MKRIVLIVVFLMFLSLVIFVLYFDFENKNVVFGVSFSPQYSRYLGFNAADAYQTMLDEWKFKYIRLSAQWDTIEAIKGQYNFKELDWLMDEAARRGAKITLAVGRKVPRWPECHLPQWVKQMKYEEYRADLLNFIKATVNRYKAHKALEIWQIENEPFLPFGLCASMPLSDFSEEVKLVKEIDNNHKVIVTDSGELSFWQNTARAGDLFGTTVYRVVWNKSIGYFTYDWLPAAFYRLKLMLNKRDINSAYVMELQAEPWFPDSSLAQTSLKQQYNSMGLSRLRKNVKYAQRLGMPRAYLWGAEWWYWMKEKQGESGYIDYVKTLRKE